MKLILSLTFILITAGAIAQDSADSTKIYFIRATGAVGMAVGFSIFIDGEPVCRINNNRHIVKEVKPGKHLLSVQVYGDKAKNKAEPVEIEVEAGKSYYMEVAIIQDGMWKSEMTFSELTEKSAKLKLSKYKVDSCL